VAASLKSQINQVTQGGTGSGPPRPVGGGTIYGGYFYGPEGVILNNPAGGSTGLGVQLLNSTDVPDLPDWDLADWFTFYATDPATGAAWTSKGLLRNDRINVRSYRRGGDVITNALDNRLDYGPFGDAIQSGFLNYSGRLGTDNYKNLANGYSVHFAKKVVLIDRSDVPWMVDYDVDVQLENCVPQSSRGNHNNDMVDGGSAGIWVDKQYDRFTIYAAWVACQPTWESGTDKKQEHGTGQEPRENRTVYGFSGFAVHTETLGINNTPNASIGAPGGGLNSIQPYFGACTYPTVSFNIMGYPLGTYRKNLGGSNASISLK